MLRLAAGAARGGFEHVHNPRFVVSPAKEKLQTIVTAIGSVLIGKEAQVQVALACLLARGHLLIEDLPGMGKTTLANAMARVLGLEYNRVQFTSDLLPADIVGVSVYEKSEAAFRFHPGPVFCQLLLADEINRTPPKTQAALLEAMQERSVTVRGEIHQLEPPFFVLATQNPIEQEGTYPLPEAQLDRFLMHVRIGYPQVDAEKRILELARRRAMQPSTPATPSAAIVTQQQIFDAQRQVLDLHMSPAVEEYLVQLLLASRNPGPYSDDLARWVSYGASPRGTIALDRCARARAWLQGRDYVSPDDVQSVAYDTLRHRILLSFEAEAEGIDADHIINELIQRVPVS